MARAHVYTLLSDGKTQRDRVGYGRTPPWHGPSDCQRVGAGRCARVRGAATATASATSTPACSQSQHKQHPSHQRNKRTTPELYSVPSVVCGGPQEREREREKHQEACEAMESRRNEWKRPGAWWAERWGSGCHRDCDGSCRSPQQSRRGGNGTGRCRWRSRTSKGNRAAAASQTDVVRGGLPARNSGRSRRPRGWRQSKVDTRTTQWQRLWTARAVVGQHQRSLSSACGRGRKCDINQCK